MNWHPIVNAPKGFTHPYSKRIDASKFLLLWTNYHVGVGYGTVDEDTVTSWWGEDGVPIEPPPTHWMFPPTPPEQTP